MTFVILTGGIDLSVGSMIPMAISLRLPDDAERRLEETAARLNVPVADLAAAAIRDLLMRPAEDFEDAARRVMMNMSA